MKALCYDFRKDSYYLDYGPHGRDPIPTQEARRLVKANACKVCCQVPKSWLK